MKGHEIEHHVFLRKLYGPLHLRVMSTTVYHLWWWRSGQGENFLDSPPWCSWRFTAHATIRKRLDWVGTVIRFSGHFDICAARKSHEVSTKSPFLHGVSSGVIFHHRVVAGRYHQIAWRTSPLRSNTWRTTVHEVSENAVCPKSPIENTVINCDKLINHRI